MSYLNEGEARAKLHMTRGEQVELSVKIRTALGYMQPAKIANYLGVSIDDVMEIRKRMPLSQVKDLRATAQPGVRREVRRR